MPSSYSLPKLVEDEIDTLVKAGYYSSKSDVVKDALRYMLEGRTDLRLAAAIGLYNDGKISLGKAAEIANMTVVEFKAALSSRSIYRNIKATRKDMKKADKVLQKIR